MKEIGEVLLLDFKDIYSDREQVLNCGKRLKYTQYKMYEDIPRELQALRKPQI